MCDAELSNPIETAAMEIVSGRTDNQRLREAMLPGIASELTTAILLELGCTPRDRLPQDFIHRLPELLETATARLEPSLRTPKPFASHGKRLSVFIEHLGSEQIRLLEARMRPGWASHTGFLDTEQSLVDVIQSDNRSLERLGVSHGQIAERLRKLFDEVPKELFDVGQCEIDQFTVARYVFMGCQECPFVSPYGVACDGGGFSDSDFTVRNNKRRLELAFSGLAPHLIGEHHFFEGNVQYRVDPARVCALLELID